MKNRRFIRLVSRVFVLAVFFVAATCHAQDRLLLEATINGQPVRFALDTGSTNLVLFPKSAARLGLAVTEIPPEVRAKTVGEAIQGVTAECDFVFDREKYRASFFVPVVPDAVLADVDGLIGWGNVQEMVFEIDARAGKVLWNAKVPEKPATWLKIKLREKAPALILEIPTEGKESRSVMVDTGSGAGVNLLPDRWKVWKEAHATLPKTLNAYYTPGAGLVVGEQMWADDLFIGLLLLSDVPVMEAPKTASEVDVLGMAALKRLEIIVDGKEGIAYVRPSKTPLPEYPHNRLGAVFVPVNLEANDLMARVAAGSPADEAGIRDGDILQKIGEIDITKWKVDPSVRPGKILESKPAGTEVEFTLSRGSRILTIKATLRNILGPRGK